MNLKLTICTFCLSIITLILPAQGLNNIWYLGYLSQAGPPWGGITMDFSAGAPIISYTSRPMEFGGRANSNISDAFGNLLFYTNGFYIADASNDTMMNGSGINPSLYTAMHNDGLIPSQLNLILPDPVNSNLYHLIHSTIDDPPGNYTTLNLYQSVIDMSLNGGLGSVIIKNNIITNDILNPGRITACKHGNGRDWWILFHKANTNVFYKMLLTPFGIQGPFSQSIGVIRSSGDAGQAVFSPDGSKYAVYALPEDLDVFEFDRCSGLLSNQTYIAINDSAYGPVGIAFSPNSQFLYASSTRYVYQYDVLNTNIASTQTTVAVWDSFYSPSPPFGTYFDIAQIAPDGKIYISTGNGTFHLHVINQPNNSSLGCDLVQHGVLLPAYHFNSLPNHPNYFLSSLSGSLCDTLTSTLDQDLSQFEIKVFPNPTKGIINLNYTSTSSIGHIEIYNELGTLVHSESLSQWTQYKNIDISNLQAGIYFCIIKWSGKLVSKKFIKQ